MLKRLLANAALAGIVAVGTIARNARAEVGPATQPSAREIKSLVANLLLPDPAINQPAQNQLAAAGDLAEPALNDLLDREGLPAGARGRIAGVLARIADGRVVTPERVALKFSNAAPAAIYDDLMLLAKLHLSAGTEQALADMKLPPTDFSASDATPWEALLKLNQSTGMVFDSVDEAGVVRLHVAESSHPAAPQATGGPILATIRRAEVTVSHGVDFGQPPTARKSNLAPGDATCRLYLGTWCNPRLKPLTWFLESVDECVTDTGANLAAGHGPMGAGITGGINGGNGSVLLLHGALGNSKRISKLHLTTTFVFERNRRTLDIATPLTVSNKDYAIDDLRVRWKQIAEREPGHYTSELTVFGREHDQSLWEHIKTTYANGRACKLLDAEGNSYKTAAFMVNYASDSVTLRSEFLAETRDGVNVGPPARFMWSFPSNVERVTVPLEFTDVALPG